MDRRKTDGGRTDADGRRADVPLAQVALPDDPSVLDLDERPELVGLAEPVRSAQLFKIVQVVGGWRVVMGDAHLERDLREAGDRFRRDPGDGRDGRFDSRVCQETLPSLGGYD